MRESLEQNLTLTKIHVLPLRDRVVQMALKLVLEPMFEAVTDREKTRRSDRQKPGEVIV